MLFVGFETFISKVQGEVDGFVSMRQWRQAEDLGTTCM